MNHKFLTFSKVCTLAQVLTRKGYNECNLLWADHIFLYEMSVFDCFEHCQKILLNRISPVWMCTYTFELYFLSTFYIGRSILFYITILGVEDILEAAEEIGPSVEREVVGWTLILCTLTQQISTDVPWNIGVPWLILCVLQGNSVGEVEGCKQTCMWCSIDFLGEGIAVTLCLPLWACLLLKVPTWPETEASVALNKQR